MTSKELHASPNGTRLRFIPDGSLGTLVELPAFAGDDRESNRHIRWDDGQEMATYGITDRWCEDLEVVE
jgi:hypothetical protein